MIKNKIKEKFQPQIDLAAKLSVDNNQNCIPDILEKNDPRQIYDIIGLLKQIGKEGSIEKRIANETYKNITTCLKANDQVTQKNGFWFSQDKDTVPDLADPDLAAKDSVKSKKDIEALVTAPATVTQIKKFLTQKGAEVTEEKIAEQQDKLRAIMAELNGINLSDQTPEVKKPTTPEVKKPTTPEIKKPTTPEIKKPTTPEVKKPTTPEIKKPTTPEIDPLSREGLIKGITDLDPNAAQVDLKKPNVYKVQIPNHNSGKSYTATITIVEEKGYMYSTQDITGREDSSMGVSPSLSSITKGILDYQKEALENLQRAKNYAVTRLVSKKGFTLEGNQNDDSLKMTFKKGPTMQIDLNFKYTGRGVSGKITNNRETHQTTRTTVNAVLEELLTEVGLSD